jgi:tRNA(Ser,Leu) C12 N-acetylase TAN1
MLHHQRQPSPSLLCVQEEEEVELSSSSFLPVGAVVRADHNEIRSNYSKAARRMFPAQGTFGRKEPHTDSSFKLAPLSTSQSNWCATV